MSLLFKWFISCFKWDNFLPPDDQSLIFSLSSKSTICRFWWRASGGRCAPTRGTGPRLTSRWPAGTSASRAGSGTTGTSTSTPPPSSRSSSRIQVGFHYWWHYPYFLMKYSHKTCLHYPIINSYGIHSPLHKYFDPPLDGERSLCCHCVMCQLVQWWHSPMTIEQDRTRLTRSLLKCCSVSASWNVSRWYDFKILPVLVSAPPHFMASSK